MTQTGTSQWCCQQYDVHSSKVSFRGVGGGGRTSCLQDGAMLVVCCEAACYEFVSQHLELLLAGETHSYEKPEVDAVLWAMQQYKPKQGAAGAGAGAGADASIMHQPLMVDVGANVGTFLFKVAAAGYRVAAFEGAWQPACTQSTSCRRCSAQAAFFFLDFEYDRLNRGWLLCFMEAMQFPQSSMCWVASCPMGAVLQRSCHAAIM